MTLPKTVQLNTGAEMPTIGLGTWKSSPTDVEKAVQIALKEGGYKHIDTAAAYGNEAAVGAGMKKSGVSRGDIFLTTKLDNSAHREVQKALDSSLQKLDAGYIDLWLMHWPAPMLHGKADTEWDWLQTWKEMEHVYQKNKDRVRAIGVSNFSIPFLTRLLAEAKVVPAVNQVELHPALPQNDLRKFCIEQGIVITSYSPLGSDNSPLLSDHRIQKIASEHGASPAQVLVSYQVHQPNTVVIPKSVTKERIIANIKTVELSTEDLAILDTIHPGLSFRACGPLWTGWGSLGMEDVERKLKERGN